MGADPAVARPERAAWARVGTGFFAGCAAVCDLPAAAFAAGVVGWLGWRAGWRAVVPAAGGLLIPVAAAAATNYLAIGQLRPAYSQYGGPWYQYDGSHWRPENMHGIDRAGEVETKVEYALNLTFGHHGLISLTPIFGLAFFAAGSLRLVRGSSVVTDTDEPLSSWWQVDLTRGAIALTLVVFAFYAVRTDNYGGLCVGPRWFFWLTPLLLLGGLPAADELSRSATGRAFLAALLVVSVFSAHYRYAEPWNHPWLYDLVCYCYPHLLYFPQLCTTEPQPVGA